MQRLAALVEDLLDLSLAESGQVRLNLTALSPGELVLRAAQAGVTLSTEIPSRLSWVTVEADRTVQVLTNLLENALRVTPPGGTDYRRSIGTTRKGPPQRGGCGGSAASSDRRSDRSQEELIAGPAHGRPALRT